MKLRKPKTESYFVEIHRDRETGVAVGETWRESDGRIHRPRQDGPAEVGRDYRTGTVLSERDTEHGISIGATRHYPWPVGKRKVKPPAPRPR